MKPIAIALGICALLLASATANAQADFTWDGARNSDWQATGPSGNNWDQPGYPGLSQAGDTATIDVATNNPVTLSGSLANSVATVTLDANANSATVSLDIQTGGSLTTTGLVLVKGEQSSSAGADSATIHVSAGTFSPSSMEFDGSTHADDGHAIANIDVDVTVSNTTTIKHLVDFDIAAGVTFDVGDLTLDSTGDLKMTGQGTSAKMEVTDWSDTSNRPIEFHATGADFVIEHQ